MADYGARYADKRIRYVDSRLREEYQQARKELTEKLDDFVRKSAERGKLKQKQRDAGLITEEEYNDWLRGQVFMRERWEKKLKQVQEVIYNHNVEAAKIVHDNKIDVFAENYNWSAYEAEKQTGISFDIINENTLANLVKKNPQILPEWKIDEEKDYKWNYRKANNSITQGIIQGESVDKITKRLVNNLCTQNKNKMRTFARTAITGAQNSGRQAQMDAVAEEGIETLKEWVATLDGRTRDVHRELDGQQVPHDKPFESSLGKIEYPGDPSAAPANVYNCRCAMITVFPKYARILSHADRHSRLGDMSYEEWKDIKRFRDQYYTKSIDRKASPDITVSAESQIAIDKTMQQLMGKFKPLKEYIKEIEYTDVPGIAASSFDGTTIRIDKQSFATIESAKKVLEGLVKDGHTVNAEDPMFMIAHEVGHSLETYIARKNLGMQTASMSGLNKQKVINEKKRMGVQYYLHMGFGEESYEEICDIIKSELGNRALDSTSELVAQAVAQITYGTKQAPHAKALVDYLVSLIGG